MTLDHVPDPDMMTTRLHPPSFFFSFLSDVLFLACSDVLGHGIDGDQKLCTSFAGGLRSSDCRCHELETLCKP